MPNQPLTDADWATIDGVRNASSYLSLLSELQKDYQPIQGFQAHSGGGGKAGSPGPIQQLATDYEQAKANKDDQADTQDKPEPPEPVNPMSIEAYKTNPQGYASRLQEWSGLHAPGAGVTSDYDQVAPPDPEDPNYVEAPGQYAADVAQWLSSRGVKAQSRTLLAQTPVEQPVPIQPGGSFADILSSASPPSVTSADLSGTNDVLPSSFAGLLNQAAPPEAPPAQQAPPPKIVTYALGDVAPKATGVLTEDVPNLVSWAAPQLGSNATPAMTEILRLLGTPYSASKAGIADSDYEKGELPPIGVDGTRDDDDLGAWVEQNYPQVFAAWQKMNP